MPSLYQFRIKTNLGIEKKKWQNSEYVLYLEARSPPGARSLFLYCFNIFDADAHVISI